MFCPQCGKDINDIVEICPICNFNFNTTLSCPYKISNRCIFNSKKCDVHGLDYEDCQTYLHKSGIEK